MRVKIHGAGSIGNHLAHAARSLGWAVDLCDVDPAALERTRTSLYPKRYSAWDDRIGLFRSGEEPKSQYDLIAVGTPPDSHITLAIAALAERPKALLIEKPMATPALESLDDLVAGAARAGVQLFVGYDHLVGAGVTRLTELIRPLGVPVTLDVEFREHWQGIFAAHPWLSGPRDTYLGFWQRGGGALGEHSHALNLWQHLALAAGAGRVAEVDATLDYVAVDGATYDRIAALNLRTERGLVGRVVQDVVTQPTRKWARLQYSDGAFEWRAEAGADVVEGNFGSELSTARFAKTRPDDFIRELRHVERCLDDGSSAESPIAGARGLDTMLVIAAAHEAARAGRRVAIDFAKGYRAEALRFASSQ
jgi:predicted dehydrogenase